jgi:hypothetical protein
MVLYYRPAPGPWLAPPERVKRVCIEPPSQRPIFTQSQTGQRSQLPAVNTFQPQPSPIAPEPAANTRKHFLKVHVQRDGDLRRNEAQCPYPVTHDLALQIVSRKPPAEPHRTQAMLSLLKPNIVYNKYSCAERCRSRGICVHFSSVLGARNAPDGLICEFCHAERKEQGVSSNRRCALHNRSGVSCYTQNLAEDYLATPVQETAARERLRRSIAGDWS